MRAFATTMMLGFAASCAGSGGEERTISPAPPVAADTASRDAEGGPALRIRAMTLLNGGEPVVRILADGTVEIDGSAAATLLPDGRLMQRGNAIARLTADGRITESQVPGLEELRVTERELLADGKAFMRVGDDGALSSVPPESGGPGWRIDGPADGRRAALYVFAILAAELHGAMRPWLGGSQPPSAE